MSLYKDRAFLKSVGIGLVMLAVCNVAVFFSTNYATKSASNAVTDIILSNTPAFDVDGLFVYGALALVVFIAVMVLIRPRYLPFSLKAVSLFTLIRSISVSLTHISPYPYHATLDPSYFITSHFFRVYFTGDDLFFSGHTGLPFLMALIFWDIPVIRFFFLGASVVLAAAVLLGHLHYSIDVFSAYFITYTIFVMAKKFFKTDYARIPQPEQPAAELPAS